MAPKLLVCDGCCCGRMEKGNNAVPIEYLKNAWKEHDLQAVSYTHLTLPTNACV